MLIIGCDFHAGVRQVALLDMDTEHRFEGRLTHEGDHVRCFCEELPASRTGRHRERWPGQAA